MSSESVMGRCRMTVPAAEKMTTKIIRTTPVLMELSVCQTWRDAERSDRAISFLFLTSCNARSAPTFASFAKSFTISGLTSRTGCVRAGCMSHYTHVPSEAMRIHPTVQVCDFNHKWPEIWLEPIFLWTVSERACFHRPSVAESPFAGARILPARFRMAAGVGWKGDLLQ